MAQPRFTPSRTVIESRAIQTPEETSHGKRSAASAEGKEEAEGRRQGQASVGLQGKLRHRQEVTPPEHFPAKWAPVRRRKCDHLKMPAGALDTSAPAHAFGATCASG